MYKKYDKSIYLTNFYDSLVAFGKNQYCLYKYMKDSCTYEGAFECILDIPAGKQREEIYTVQSSKGLRPGVSENV